MTKAALCTVCADIVSPHRAWQTDRTWRHCECGQMGVRWRDGDRGLLDVTAVHGPDTILVLGLNNMFLGAALQDAASTPRDWRDLHTATCEQVEPNYLFHVDRRNCWALLTRVGDSGDIIYVDQAEVDAAPGNSADRVPSS